MIYDYAKYKEIAVNKLVPVVRSLLVKVTRLLEIMIIKNKLNFPTLTVLPLFGTLSLGTPDANASDQMNYSSSSGYEHLDSETNVLKYFSISPDNAQGGKRELKNSSGINANNKSRFRIKSLNKIEYQYDQNQKITLKDDSVFYMFRVPIW